MMTQRQLASVLFAVIGIFIAASRFPEVFMHVAVLTTPDDGPAAPVSRSLISIMGLIGSLLGLFIGAALVLLSDDLCIRLFPPTTQPLSWPDVQPVALSVLGCYFAVVGLSRVVWSRGVDWSGATQLVLGLGLFFGARRLSRLWSLGRRAGTSDGAV
jgi:hypothetical protein